MKNSIFKLIPIMLAAAIILGGIYYYRTTHNLEKQIEMFRVNNEAAQKRAVAYLVREGKRAIPYLVDALNADDPTVRGNAVEALGRINEPDVINPLIGMLTDPDPNIQYTAMESMENRGSMAVPALIKTAQAQNMPLRAKSIELLGRIGDSLSKEVIREALADDSPEVRAQAVIALRWVAFEDSVEYILPMIKDADNNVRMMVVFALGDMPESSGARRALEKALQNSDEQLREKAVYFLGKTGNPDTEKALCGILKDKELKVRWTAVEALGKVGNDLALRELTTLLLRGREVEFVKNAAKKAIQKIHERKEGK